MQIALEHPFLKMKGLIVSFIPIKSIILNAYNFKKESVGGGDLETLHISHIKNKTTFLTLFFNLK